MSHTSLMLLTFNYRLTENEKKFYSIIRVETYVELRKLGLEISLNKGFGNGVLDEIRCIFNTELIGKIASMGLNSADT